MAVTYKYKRSDDTYFEIKQSINDEPLTQCPETELPCKRVFAGNTEIYFMGKGWQKSVKQTEKNKKARLTDPLYTTDPSYKKKLEQQLEKDHTFAQAYEKKKHELKKKFS